MLAAGLGAVFGFQVWRFAVFGALSIPRPLSASIFLCYVLLGSISRADQAIALWKRATFLGLTGSIPLAYCVTALGWKRVPDGLALLTAGLTIGLLLARIAAAIGARPTVSQDQRCPGRQSPSGRSRAIPETRSASILRQRIAEEAACLERLYQERISTGDSGHGRNTEDRIVWGELLDLELQDIDEQVERICRSADLDPWKGGSHEFDGRRRSQAE